MADNVSVKSATGQTFEAAMDVLSDSSHSPKISLLDGSGSPTPISPATEGTLASVDNKLPTKGAKASSGSVSVVMANDYGNLVVAGNVASGATDSGNPIKVGGVYNSTLPTLTNGQRGDLQVSSRGIVATYLTSNVGTAVTIATPNANQATGITTIATLSTNFVYNATESWARQPGNSTGTIFIPPTGWNYPAPAAGINNSTTGVTIKAAAGAGVRNYLTGLQIDNDTLSGATTLVVRDGAGGTVLWRGKVQTAAGSRAVRFDTPLYSSAATLLEIATETAATGAVCVNAQGYTAI